MNAADGARAEWWSVTRQLWWRDLDELGHLTAARYADLYQEACGDFVVEAWGDDTASYVVSRMTIDYLHEVTRADSPVRLLVRVARVGRSGFDLALGIETATGRLCSTARGAYAAWDRDLRCARTMTESEGAGLLRMPRDPAYTGSANP